MNKKVVLVSVGIIFFIIIILGVIWYIQFSSDQEKYSKDFEQYINKGMLLIQNGKYLEGLNECYKFSYSPPTICNALIVQLKQERKEKLTKNFCDQITVDYMNKTISLPFSLKAYFLFGSSYSDKKIKKDFIEIKERCYKSITVS